MSMELRARERCGISSSNQHMPPSRTTPYGPLANVYDAFLTLTGFKRGVENFLDRVHFELAPKASILDAGCGTGLLTLYLARRFPTTNILATDVDERMLAQLERLINEEGIEPHRVQVASSDLNNPKEIHERATRCSATLDPESFDLVTISGALEHVSLDSAVKRIVELLKPGGIFFSLNVRRNPAGAVLAMVYKFRPYTVAELRHALAEAGLTDIRALRLQANDFPANLSRVALIARKPA